MIVSTCIHSVNKTSKFHNYCVHICYAYIYVTHLLEPSDSPQNFTSTPNKTTVTLTWTKPATPNGIIIKYSLVVNNLNTMTVHNYTIPVSINQLTVTQLVDCFSPYQNYTASVSASTIIGAGPVATTAGRTLPDSKYNIMIHLLKYNTQFLVHLIW